MLVLFFSAAFFAFTDHNLMDHLEAVLLGGVFWECWLTRVNMHKGKTILDRIYMNTSRIR